MRLVITVFAVLGMGSSASANVIAYWNFNSYDGNATTISADSGIGTLSMSSGLGAADVDNPAGSTINVIGLDPAGSALAILNATATSPPRPIVTSNNGEYLQLAFSMTGLEVLILSYATASGAQSFNSNEWLYSTNGTTFTSFASGLAPSPPFALVVENFGPLLDNQATAYLRYQFNGASTTFGNRNQTNRLDNIQLTATPIPPAVPEPGSLALLSSGLLCLAFLRKRSRSQTISSRV